MMKNLCTNLIMSDQQNGEFAGKAVYPKEYNSAYNDFPVNQFMDLLNKVVMIEKSNVAIAKKGADTSAYISKVYVDSVQEYINYLIGENRKKDIMSEEREKNNIYIENALLRLQEESQESRRQPEEGLFSKVFLWGMVLLGGVLCIGGCVACNRV